MSTSDDPYRYFDGATFKEGDHCKRCDDARIDGYTLDDNGEYHRIPNHERFHCKQCGRPLNDEVALVNGEQWCHACADEGPVKYQPESRPDDR